MPKLSSKEILMQIERTKLRLRALPELLEHPERLDLTALEARCASTGVDVATVPDLVRDLRQALVDEWSEPKAPVEKQRRRHLGGREEAPKVETRPKPEPRKPGGFLQQQREAGLYPELDDE